MERILTISTAASNTENVLKIEQEYAHNYTQSLFSIHKENDEYISTINTSITLASGYFKSFSL